MRILITGSRDWPFPEWVDDAICDVIMETRISGRLADGEEVVIVHGDAEGADLAGKATADRLREAGRPVRDEAHPARWRRSDGSVDYAAGFNRNQEMVDLGADICLAFIGPCRKHPDEEHFSHGGEDTVKRAEAAGIKTRVTQKIYPPKGGEKPAKLRRGERDTSEVWKPYVRDLSLPQAYIVDIDGTIAKANDRGWYDWTKVSQDSPVADVIHLIEILSSSALLIFVSGRSDACRSDTSSWLRKHVNVSVEGLFMREDGDDRKDSVVKHEIFWRDIADKYNILGAIDDRDQVVKMWRDIGVTVFQCAYGDF